MSWRSFLRVLFRRSESVAQGGLPRTDTFSPVEWDQFFGSLDPASRSAGAARLCEAIASRAGAQSQVVDEAVQFVAAGAFDERVLSRIEALLKHFEDLYDALVGDDEGRLVCAEPDIRQAYDRARAVSAVMFALRGEYTGMAYEAGSAIGQEMSFDEILSYFIPDVDDLKRD